MMSSTVQHLSIKLEYPDHRGGRSEPAVPPQEDQIYYSPGDYMEGVVVVALNHSLMVRGLYLNVLGQALAAWENPIKRKTYEDSETHLDHWEPLLSDTGLTAIPFPAGYHRFAFRVQLPDNLPSTFHGTYGSITYVAKVTLDTENELLRDVTTQPFMVLRRDPLPQQAYSPVELSKSKLFLNLNSGKIKVSVHLDHAVAVPGEVVLVNAQVSNWSGKEITLLEGSLVMEGYYRAMKRQLIYRQYLSKRQDFYDVNVQWGRRWTDVKIQVPPHLADAGLEACNIIDVRYFFQFRVQIRGEKDIVLEAPLYIGYHRDIDPIARDPKVTLMNRMLMEDPVQQTGNYRPK